MSTTTQNTEVRVTLTRVLRGEWIKIRGQRSNWWILGLAVVVPPLASLVWAAATSPASEARADQVNAVVGAATSSTFETLVLLVLFGAAVASNELDSRTITTTLAAVPRRWPVVLAKAVIVLAVAVVVTLISATLAFLLSSMVMSTAEPLTLTDPVAMRVIAGTVIFASSTAVIALSAALVIRSSLGAIAVTFGFLYVVPGVFNLISLAPIVAFAHTFPGPASDSLIAMVDIPGDLPYPAAAIAILVWTLVWVGGAIALVARRDV